MADGPKITGVTFDKVLKRAMNLPMAQAGKIVRDELRAESPGKRFKKSIVNEKLDDYTQRIFINNEGDVRIGEFTAGGTRAHGPTTAKALRFFIKGKEIFAKRVKGITATHWWSKAKDRALTKVNKLFSDHLNKFK